jgi:hypothetical protein
MCEKACDHAEEIGCVRSLTPANATCEEACSVYEANGGNFCTKELLAADTCTAIEHVALYGCEK